MNETIMKKVIEDTKEKYRGKFSISEMSYFYREYDESYEILGKIDDPTLDIRDFEGREMLFPKRWVTLNVIGGV